MILLYNLGLGSNGIEVLVKLNGIFFFMELDIGVGVFFIFSEIYIRYFKDIFFRLFNICLYIYIGYLGKGIWLIGSVFYILRLEC